MSDIESDARNNSGHFHMAEKKGEADPEDAERLNFYNHKKFFSCNEIDKHDYEIETKIKNKISITFRETVQMSGNQK